MRMIASEHNTLRAPMCRARAGVVMWELLTLELPWPGVSAWSVSLISILLA